MTRYAAFLRGIMPSNPNMRNDRLRAVVEGLGFDGVGSVLSSGNIVFGCAQTDPAELEDKIQAALRAELGIGGGTIVRARDELRALVDSDPFADLTHGRGSYLTATFLKQPMPGPLATAPPELAAAVRVVRYDVPARAVLSVIDNTSAETSKYMGWVEQVYGKDITTRTWLTVHKVLAKL
ncbi:DUF1697 domain-containing protein [Nocardia stercoris]|uniref:DUF1697 domain-containing protein n=1 Tax=Nocardia stercoris TaxID=2483361 RepID=A0A3M2LD65_9NOCA|nr:DUF1697 domain-containing protein [Nocardia stercoris]RMI35412.1 DUF1697 domain-containing protein [Nocardia stercoris]